MSAALLLVSSISVPPVSADVIELRSGQRVKGTSKGADDGAVRIEGDGRIVTFAPAEVCAIYYGGAHSAGVSADAGAAPGARRGGWGRSRWCGRLRRPE